MDEDDYDIEEKKKAVRHDRHEVERIEEQLRHSQEEFNKIKDEMNRLLIEIQKETIAKDNLVEEKKSLDKELQDKLCEKRVAEGKKKVLKIGADIESHQEIIDEKETAIDNRKDKISDLKYKIQRTKKEKEKMEDRIKQQSAEKEDKWKLIEKQEEEIKQLEEKENTFMSKPFRELPEDCGKLNEKVKKYYLSEFQNLENLPVECSCINVLLVGPSGSGKSSFVNTCATALKNKNRMVHVSTTREFASSSATLKLIPEELEVSKERNLKAKIFDCRGLSPSDIGKDEISLIIGGHIRHYSEITDAETMKKNGKMYIEEPSVNQEMHCIVYVVKAANSNQLLDDETQKHLTGIMEKLTPTSKPQFVLLTKIDSIVPGKDIENLFNYKCVGTKCKKVCTLTHVPPGYILPMANYTTESMPTDAKDALGLSNLYRIVSSGYDYVIRRVKEDRVKMEEFN